MPSDKSLYCNTMFEHYSTYDFQKRVAFGWFSINSWINIIVLYYDTALSSTVYVLLPPCTLRTIGTFGRRPLVNFGVVQEKSA